MMNSGATVSAELGLRSVDPEHGAVPLIASLYYSVGDPYAILMAFHVGTDDPVEWIFSRDLLTAGLHGPAGAGDVQVWPADQHGLGVLNIALSPPFGQALFQAPTTPLAAVPTSPLQLIPPSPPPALF